MRGLHNLPKTTKRAALYVRVSTDHKSVDNQLQELGQIAERRGLGRRRDLPKGVRIGKTARLTGLGVGTVHKLKREMASTGV